MDYQAAQHQTLTPFTPLEVTLIRIGFPLYLCCPHLIERIVLLIFKTIVLFAFPICVLAYHSHTHMQKKNRSSTSTSASSATAVGSSIASSSIPFPIYHGPPVFTKPPSRVPQDNYRNGPGNGNNGHGTTSSHTYAPTIPLGRSLPSALSPPPSPLGDEDEVEVEIVGPSGPILCDGRWQFQVEGLIASGTYGRVALARVVGTTEPPTHVALKVYSKDQLIADPWLLDVYDLERRILVDNTRNNTQWLVQSRGMFGDLWNRYLIMDYYPNALSGIIFDSTCTRLPRRVARLWVEELALGMYELYNRNIVHCDLKPGNILVSQRGHLAIADFGISMVPEAYEDPTKPFEECNFYGYGGTYAYQAPEMLICHSKAHFTCAADMWSFGVIIYEMYTSKRLFSAEANVVRNEIWSMNIPAKVREDIDDPLARELVIDLLELDPDRRLKLRDLAQHPFFMRTDWHMVVSKNISIDFDKAKLSSSSWREALEFERPLTPDSLSYYQRP